MALAKLGYVSAATPATTGLCAPAVPPECTGLQHTAFEIIYPSTADASVYVRTGYLFNSLEAARKACQNYNSGKVVQTLFNVYE